MMPHRSKTAKNSLELKNFQAWIEIGGNKLDCHAVDIPNKRTRDVSCWIASEENKTFAVKVRKLQPSNWHCRVSLSLDGHKVDATIFEKLESHTTSFKGLSTNESIRYFQFAPLNVTDEEQYRNAVDLRPQARKIGEITVTVHRITHLKLKKHKKSDTSDSGDKDCMEEDSDKLSVPQPLKVYESSLKASLVPHQISFGDPVPRGHKPVALRYGGIVKDDYNTDYYSTTWYDKKECIATFTFRYRPLNVLIDAGIVPRRLLSNPGPATSQHIPTLSEEPEEDPSEAGEEEDTDDGEFRGSPPSIFDDGAARRASTRGLGPEAPNGGGVQRINYADYDSGEPQDDGSDWDDIYVHTDEEKQMRGAPAQTQEQAEVETGAPNTTTPGARDRPQTTPNATPGPSNIKDSHLQGVIGSSAVTASNTANTALPATCAQQSLSPRIRQESPQSNPELEALSTANNADMQTSGSETLTLVNTVYPADEQSRQVKREDIEARVPSMGTAQEAASGTAIGQLNNIQLPLSTNTNPVDQVTRRVKSEEIEMQVPSTREIEAVAGRHAHGPLLVLPLPTGSLAADRSYRIKLEEVEIKPVVKEEDDDEEDDEERSLRLQLAAIKERKRKAKEFQQAEATKRVKIEEEARFYFKPGEVIDLVSG